MEQQGYEILYLDETMFTRKAVAKTEWAAKRTNLEIDEDLINEPAFALELAISDKQGVVLGKSYKKSVNIDKFLDFIAELRQLQDKQKICLFMDNLSVHRSRKVLNELDKHGIRYIFNLPYKPELNPIEFVFSKVKQSFKTLRVEKLARGMRPNI